MSKAMQRLCCHPWAGAVLVFLMFPLAAKAHLYLAYILQAQATEQDKNGSAMADATPTEMNTPDTRGNVEGHTYKNPFLDLEFTFPDDLEFAEPQIDTDPPTGRRIIGVRAGSKPRNRFSLRKYIVDEAIMFVADPLARYSVDQRTDDGYMRIMSQVEKAQGFKQTGNDSIEKIGAIEFSRANFVHGSRWHVVLATKHKDYALVFIFVSNDIRAADTLIRLTSVKLSQ